MKTSMRGLRTGWNLDQEFSLVVEELEKLREENRALKEQIRASTNFTARMVDRETGRFDGSDVWSGDE